MYPTWEKENFNKFHHQRNDRKRKLKTEEVLSFSKGAKYGRGNSKYIKIKKQAKMFLSSMKNAVQLFWTNFKLYFTGSVYVCIMYFCVHVSTCCSFVDPPLVLSCLLPLYIHNLVYFVWWHSLSSLQDHCSLKTPWACGWGKTEVNFIKLYNIKQYRYHHHNVLLE